MKNKLYNLLQQEKNEQTFSDLLNILEENDLFTKELSKVLTTSEWLRLYELAIKNDKSQIVKSIKNTLFLTYDLELLKTMWKLSPINDEIFEVLPILFKDMNNSNMPFNETGEVDNQCDKARQMFTYLKEQKIDWNTLSEKENIYFHASSPLLYELMELPTNKLYISALKHATFYSINKNTKFWLEKVSIKGIEHILLSRNINPEMKNQFAGASEIRFLLINKYMEENLPLNNETWIEFQKRYKTTKNPLVLQELTDLIIEKAFDITFFTAGELAKSLCMSSLDKNKKFFKQYGFDNQKLEINLIRKAIIEVRKDLIDYYIENLPNTYKYLNTKEFKDYKSKIKALPKHDIKNAKNQYEALEYFEILAMNKKLQSNLKSDKKNNKNKLKL